MKCNYCGKALKKDAKVCEKCGKEVGKELTDLEKIEKKVKGIGVTVNAFGWFILIFNIIIYFFGGEVLDFAPSLSSLVITGSFSVILIILGNRIKNFYDKNIKKYLTISLVLTILFTLLILYSGGNTGLVGIFLLIYLISSVSSYNKLLKEDEYKEKLEEKEHKIKKFGWVILVISMGIVYWLSLSYDINNLYTDITPDDVEEVVAFIENSYDLPQTIDEVTVWTDVTAEEGAIRYHYELSNLSERNVSEELLRDFIEDGICADTDVANTLKGGINMEYSYTVKETGEKFLVVFTEEDCI